MNEILGTILLFYSMYPDMGSAEHSRNETPV